MTSVRETAARATRAGLVVIPPREDGTKAPEGSWGQWRESPPSVEQLRRWYANGRQGVGIATDRAHCLDFDNPDTYKVFRDTAEASGIGDLVDRIEAGYLETTPDRGRHWLFYCDTLVPTTKLARRPAPTEDNPHNVETLIEVKGIGGYAVIAPSGGSVHPTGRGYELVSGSIETIVTITGDEWQLLAHLAAAFDEMPKEERQPAESIDAGDDTPGNDFISRTDWRGLLESRGWQQVGQRGDIQYWRRPGKDRGISATVNGPGITPDRLYVFTSSTLLEPNRSYTRFQAYCYLVHGGDFTAAAKQLRADGYGSKTSSRSIKGPTVGKGKPVGETPDGVVLDDFRAYMPDHKYIFIPSRELWPSSSVNARLGRIDEGDDNIAASTWLDRYAPVEQMTWAPGEPTLIDGRLISNGGWIHRQGLTCFNLYRPATMKPGNDDGATPWVEHILKIYPTEAEHIITWLAHRVQFPGEKINHALVLGGQQGIGKDSLLEPVKYAIGPWNFQEVSPVQLLGRFNGFVKSVILRVSEARDLGDVDRYGFYEHMKVYTAAPPDVLRCDEKNVREYSVMNVCGVIITTNHKTDGIYLPSDDRRHFVAWSEATMSDFDADYWSNLYGWYEDGGYADVYAYLLSLDLSDFNPKSPPPKTQAFWDIVDANRAPEDAELADALEALQYPDATTIESIANRSTVDFAAWINERKNRRQIPHRMEAAGYVPVRNESASDGLWKIGSRRQMVYGRRDLQLRDRIAAAQQLTGR